MNAKLIFLAIAWGLIETAYFGWNWAPQSSAELACDAIALLLAALAVVIGPERAT